PHIEADVRDTEVLSQQQLLGLLNPPARKELVRRLAKCAGKQTGEMEGRQTGFAGGIFQRDAVTVAVADVVTRAAQACERRHIVEPNFAARSQLGAPCLRPHGAKYST